MAEVLHSGPLETAFFCSTQKKLGISCLQSLCFRFGSQQAYSPPSPSLQISVLAAIHEKGVTSATSALLAAHVLGRWVSVILSLICHFISDDGDDKVWLCKHRKFVRRDA